MKLSVTIDRDEDGVWVVKCPAIPGCVSQGDTREQAIANIREAIALCLEVRAEQGMPLTIETEQIEVDLGRRTEAGRSVKPFDPPEEIWALFHGCDEMDGVGQLSERHPNSWNLVMTNFIAHRSQLLRTSQTGLRNLQTLIGSAGLECNHGAQ